MVLLQCVDAREVEHILVEVHEGSFGTHANGHAMACKILRAGYYWLTIENGQGAAKTFKGTGRH